MREGVAEFNSIAVVELEMSEMEGIAGVTRPVPRRLTPSAQSPGTDSHAPTFSNVQNETLSSLAKQQHKSAWARYESPGTARSPIKGVSPPPVPEVNSATQAAAQKMWEKLASAKDTHAPPTSPPDSPMGTRNPLAASKLLTWPQQPEQNHMQGAYLASLKAAICSQLGTSAVPGFAGEHGRVSSQLLSNLQPMFHSGGLDCHKLERPDPANGSLSILPEREGHLSALRSPGAQPQDSRGTGASGLAHIARLSQQLEELLRGQCMSQQPSMQLPILASEPPIHGGDTPAPQVHSSALLARYGSQDSMRELALGGMDLESLRSDATAVRAERRWNSVGSLVSESSHLTNTGFAQQPLAPCLFPNFSANDNQTLLQSIQLLCQANEMAALANSRIQACSLAANANLEELAGNRVRKRKLPDYCYEVPKRHNSTLSDVDAYSYNSSQVQQICAECGTTSTPTWRRSGKKLMCNACGLRRSRSMRSARTNSVPSGHAVHHEMP